MEAGAGAEPGIRSGAAFVSSLLRLGAGLAVAALAAWALSGDRSDLALLGWLPGAVSAVAGRVLAAVTLRPGSPPLLALAGQVARVALVAGVLVGAEDRLGADYRAFAAAGLGSFGVLMAEEIVDLLVRSRRMAEPAGG